MAYYGNLALRPERAPQPPAQKPREPQKSKAVRRRQLPIGEKLLYLFTIAVVVLVAGTIIYRYAEIYQINGKIQEKNRIYEQTNDQMKELQREVERLGDPKRIMEKAKEFGMVPVETQGITVTSQDGQPPAASKR